MELLSLPNSDFGDDERKQRLIDWTVVFLRAVQLSGAAQRRGSVTDVHPRVKSPTSLSPGLGSERRKGSLGQSAFGIFLLQYGKWVL